MAPTLHRTSENIRGSIRPCGSRPDFCNFFTSCFCTTAWCCHDAMRVPTTRRRQDAPSSSGRGVPTTPPSIVGRGVLTMPPRVVRTSWRRHDAPPVPRRQLRFSDERAAGKVVAHHGASPNPEKSSLECSVRPLAAATAPKKLRFMPLVRPTAQHWGTWQLCGGRVRRASNR